MIGWIVALILLALLLLLKVGVRFRWDNDCSVLKIRIGCVRFSLSTDQKKQKNKKARKPKNTKEIQQKSESQSLAQGKQKKSISPALKSWIRALIDCRGELLALIGKVLTSPTLDLLRLHIDVGGNDAEMQYGKICAGLGAGLPVLYHTFRVKKDDIRVSCRYDIPKIKIMAEVEATVMIYEIFTIIGTVIGLLVKLYLTKKRNDKAVRKI